MERAINQNIAPILQIFRQNHCTIKLSFQYSQFIIFNFQKHSKPTHIQNIAHNFMIPSRQDIPLKRPLLEPNHREKAENLKKKPVDDTRALPARHSSASLLPSLNPNIWPQYLGSFYIYGATLTNQPIYIGERGKLVVAQKRYPGNREIIGLNIKNRGVWLSLDYIGIAGLYYAQRFGDIKLNLQVVHVHENVVKLQADLFITQNIFSSQFLELEKDYKLTMAKYNQLLKYSKDYVEIPLRGIFSNQEVFQTDTKAERAILFESSTDEQKTVPTNEVQKEEISTLSEASMSQLQETLYRKKKHQSISIRQKLQRLRTRYQNWKTARSSLFYFLNILGIKKLQNALIHPLIRMHPMIIYEASLSGIPMPLSNEKISRLFHCRKEYHVPVACIKHPELQSCYEYSTKPLFQPQLGFQCLKELIGIGVEIYFQDEEFRLAEDFKRERHFRLKLLNPCSDEKLNAWKTMLRHSFEVSDESHESVMKKFHENMLILKQYAQPEDVMHSELRPYQLQAMTFMKYREDRIPFTQLFKPECFTPEDYEKKRYERKLSPFVELLQLPCKSKIYVNRSTFEVSLNEPQVQKTLGGILADDMGLGKTVMTLGLIGDDLANSDIEAGEPRTNLIVVPLTVLTNWADEINKHLRLKLKVLLFHGKQREKKDIGPLNTFDIVLTTYQLLGIQFKKFQNNQKRAKHQQSLFDYRWRRVVLDEAHNIKSRDTLAAKGAFLLDSKYRWCMTGTPLQNNANELYSIIKFLRVSVYSDWDYWRDYVTNADNQNEKTELLHAILKPLMLRRTKQTKGTQGDKIISLPTKFIHLYTLDFSPLELTLYSKFYDQSKDYIQKLNGTFSYTNIFQIIASIRMFCDHPSLVFHNITNREFNDETQMKKLMSKLFEKKERTEFQQEVEKNLMSIQSMACSICLEDSKSMGILKCAHIFCMDCLLTLRKRECPICRLNFNPEDINVIKGNNLESNLKKAKQSMGIVSAKQKKIMEIIEAAVSKSEKLVVFSQWIRMLDLLQNLCTNIGIGSSRIDGSMTKEARYKNKEKFREDPETRVIFLSMAAATGLNLIEATHVIICDPWWNPAIQDQATERVYRFGQTKQVHVHKFQMNTSIQIEIYRMHEMKRKQLNQVLMTSKKAADEEQGSKKDELIQLMRRNRVDIKEKVIITTVN